MSHVAGQRGVQGLEVFVLTASSALAVSRWAAFSSANRLS